MPNYLRHRGNQGTNAPNTDRGPSPYIWGDCPWLEMEADPNLGVRFFDDFTSFTLPGTQTSELSLGYNGWKVYNTGAGTVKTNASLDGTLTSGGIISMLADTAGDGSAIANQACPFVLSGLTTNSGKLWFEARIALTVVTTNNVQLFVGLGENSGYTLGAAKPLGDADAVASDVPFIGLNVTEDGLGVVRGVYADEAATWTAAASSVGTLSASTFAKVGMVYDPEDTTNCIQFFFNGVPSTSVISQSTLTGLTNLDVSPLGPVFATFADSAGTSTYAYMDWIRIAQRAPNS